ncbi:universal stress protein [Jonesia quinghaiensis]|uniref:universal stress protein n=1 Tax=Jonesia quinghaiensis TaxID=262806 RepID=UPI000A05C3C3|nr:universal stress protein [Jonesia quinghaiensis]
MPVLVAYNDSPQGEAAFFAALNEAERRSEGIVVLVLTPAPDDAPVPSHLAQLISTAGRAVDIAFRSDSLDVADAILDHAERIGACMIVLGSKKRSPIGKFILGSTTQRVLLDSPVPVLVVKGGLNEG